VSLNAQVVLLIDLLQINRKILPAFYALLLTPPITPTDKQPQPPQPQQQQPLVDPSNHHPSHPSLPDQHNLLANTLTSAITSLVDASHQTGPFFLGDTISFVDVAFAPWIIRLSRVLSHYRNFPRPEVGSRWRLWVDAIEADERVRNTVSDEGSYHNVYGAVGEVGREALGKKKGMVEVEYAKRVVREEGFGMGGDVWGAVNE
jgi:Glutathione S-transferase, C-terminal domain